MPIEAIGQRVTDLAHRVERLENTQPAVIASQLADLMRDVTDLRTEIRTDVADLRAEFRRDANDIRGEVKGMKRLLVSALVTVMTGAVGSSLTILLTIGGK